MKTKNSRNQMWTDESQNKPNDSNEASVHTLSLERHDSVLVGNEWTVDALKTSNRYLSEIRTKNAENVQMLKKILEAIGDLVKYAATAEICPDEKELIDELRRKFEVTTGDDSRRLKANNVQEITVPEKVFSNNCRKQQSRSADRHLNRVPPKLHRRDESRSNSERLPNILEVPGKHPKSRKTPRSHESTTPRPTPKLKESPNKRQPLRRWEPSPPKEKACPPSERKDVSLDSLEGSTEFYSRSDEGYDCDTESCQTERNFRRRDRPSDRYRRNRRNRIRGDQRKYRQRRHHDRKRGRLSRRGDSDGKYWRDERTERKNKHRAKRYQRWCPCMTEAEPLKDNEACDGSMRYNHECNMLSKVEEQIDCVDNVQPPKDEHFNGETAIENTDGNVDLTAGVCFVDNNQLQPEKAEKPVQQPACDCCSIRLHQSRYRIRHYDVIRPGRGKLPSRRYNYVGPLNRIPGEPTSAKMAGHNCQPYYYTHKTRGQILRRIRRESFATYTPTRFYMPYRFWLYTEDDLRVIQLQPLIVRTPRSMPKHFTLKNTSDLRNALEYLNPVENDHGQSLFKRRAILRAEVDYLFGRISKRYDECLYIARRSHC